MKQLTKFYKEKYKPLMWIMFILLLLSICQIAYQTATTGDFVNRGITLKGGISLTVFSRQSIDTDSLIIFVVFIKSSKNQVWTLPPDIRDLIPSDHISSWLSLL